MISGALKALGIYRVYRSYLKQQIKKGKSPDHVAIVLDGNRRWAQKMEYTRSMGHIIGADRVEELLDWCNELGIKTITLYVLSTENLERPADEVQELMGLLEERFVKLLKDPRIVRDEVRVKVIGRRELLPERIQLLLNEIEKKTEKYSRQFLNIAVAYGGRAEILDVIKKIGEEVRQGRLDPKEITSQTVEGYLYTAHLPNPEPDMIIRTSGEERLSGFLLWQGAYSELIFLDVYWPEFRKIDLMRVIRTYQKRTRRFGR